VIRFPSKFAKQFKLPLFFCQIQIKKSENFWCSTECSVYCRRVTYVTDKKWSGSNDFDSMLATKHIPKALEAIKKLV
jgi:peroxiredoxin Q/BCP